MADPTMLVDEIDVAHVGPWIMSQLEMLTTSGDYTSESLQALQAVIDIADKIEHGRITDDARKPTADILRCLSHFVLRRKIRSADETRSPGSFLLDEMTCEPGDE